MTSYVPTIALCPPRWSINGKIAPRSLNNESGANRRLNVLPFGSRLHCGVPARQRGAPVPVAHLDSDLQQQIGAGFGPPYVLLLHKPLTDHLADRRFCKPGRNGFSLLVALAVVWNKCSMIGDVRLKGADRL